MPQIVQAIVELLPPFIEALSTYPNRRVVHLATRHRDPLVRKKNQKRLVRMYKKLKKLR